MGEEKLGWIDSIKGIAVIMIFVVHCVGITYPILAQWTTYGQYGVELFLLCNGFCSVKSYVNPGRNRKKIFTKKLMRILPVFWLMLVVSYFLNYVQLGESFNNLSYLMKNNLQASWGAVISSALLINFVSPSWGYFSLFSETYVVSNIVLILILGGIKKNDFETKKVLERSMSVVLLCGMINLLIVPFEYGNIDKVVFYYIQYNMRGICAFFVGVILYHVYMCEKPKISYRERNVCSATIVMLMFFQCVYSKHYNSTFFVISVAFLLICQMMSGNGFSYYGLSFLGRYSWSFYFIHVIIYYALYDYLTGIVLLGSTFLISLVLSIILTELFEKPIIKRLVN